MRRIVSLSPFLLVAACATQQPTASVPTQPAPPPSEHTRGQIIGLTAEELVQRFGLPALQIREGDSLKLQFRSRLCVLDAYLYPPGAGRTDYRVTYVDTRTPSLGSIDQIACVASFATP